MKSKLYVSSVACLSIFTLASCGGGDGGLSSNSPGATSASATSATPITAAIDNIGNPGPTPITVSVPGWPNYLAMGAVGGPNTFPPTNPPTKSAVCVPPFCQDDFGGSPVDAAFKYSGVAGAGDPGSSGPPGLALMMASDMNGTQTPFPQPFNGKLVAGLSAQNNKVVRPILVEYMWNGSGGWNVPPGLLAPLDFTDTSDLYPNMLTGSGNYFMSRHFAVLIGDVQALYANPISYNGQNYYGSIILNPDAIGYLQQNSGANSNYPGLVNQQLATTDINLAVKRAVCTMTAKLNYQVTFNPNDTGQWSPITQPVKPFIAGSTYTMLKADGTPGYAPGSSWTFDKAAIPFTYASGTAVEILTQMYQRGYPISSPMYPSTVPTTPEKFWSTNTRGEVTPGSGIYTVVGTQFNTCATNPVYDTSKYNIPNFPRTLEGWAQAQNWIIRTFAPPVNGQNTVTFGWHENISAVNATGGWWVHNTYPNTLPPGAAVPPSTTPQDFTTINAVYSLPVSQWICGNIPSAVWPVTSSQTTYPTGGRPGDACLTTPGGLYAPDFIVFDRYEVDDSVGSPGAATLYSARDWDNFLNGIGLVSKNFKNIPIMAWQIPGASLPITGNVETNPTIGNIFSSASAYFFGDSNAAPNLSNMIAGDTAPGTVANMIGNYPMIPCAAGPQSYNCLTSSTTYKQYLQSYPYGAGGASGTYNWSVNNGKLALAASNNVFAIMWGGGQTTNVIYNLISQPGSDSGRLKQQLINYYGWTPPGNLTPSTAAK